MKRTPKPKVKEEKVKQLDLGIKEPFKNKVLKIKGKTDGLLLQLEVKKFLKDAFFWFVLVFNIVMALQQGLIIYQTYEKLPSLIPVLNYYIVTLNSLADKRLLFIFPAITIFNILVGLFVTAKYYNREKILTKFVLLCTLLTSIAQSIIIIHLTWGY